MCTHTIHHTLVLGTDIFDDSRFGFFQKTDNFGTVGRFVGFSKLCFKKIYIVVKDISTPNFPRTLLMHRKKYS